MTEQHPPQNSGFAAPDPLPEVAATDGATAAAYTGTGGAAAPEVEVAPRKQRSPRARKLVAFGAVSALAVGAVATGLIVTTDRGDTADAASAYVEDGTGADSTSPDWEQLYRDLYESLQEQGQQGTQETPDQGDTWSGNSVPGGNGYSGGTDGYGTDGGLGSQYGGTGTLQEDATTASDAESTGIVLIDTVLGYQSAEAAGSGMVLTDDGLILTNNHVVEGATDITVTIGSTGETYTANVIGTDATEDVALLQLQGASGLTTVTIDDDEVAVGDTVTAVGNAEGGGVLMAADGSVTELDSSVTTSSEYGVEGETLDGMIEFAADVVGGDSGGALIDDEGEVVGMTTAASSGTATTIAYAVPIDEALEIAQQIQDGDESGTVSIGYPAMLGVAIASDSAGVQGQWGSQGQTATEGATVQGVYDDTPAAKAGLEAGDIITAVDGTAVASASALSEAISAYEPGDSVTLTWTDSTGAEQQATVTLTEGPVA
ncbi:S1C family serine protease [Demequina sp. NBRC 110057]|uniref:S1C family serine protease n=1 Tax=Demequina sp. NBRC 110057 TaxID=1570346 RepID=UPI001177CA2D|nr:trypsin-like peptidase domain-containing protein [Demequina sp. NBRC 110057]